MTTISGVNGQKICYGYIMEATLHNDQINYEPQSTGADGFLPWVKRVGREDDGSPRSGPRVQ
jgi:hypothetical protein